MGCSGSKNSEQNVATAKPLENTQPSAETKNPPSDGPKPPMGFAIMRNAHEAFRVALKEITELLDSAIIDNKVDQDKIELFVSEWTDFMNAQEVHLEIENLDMFKLLAQFSSEETIKVLYEAHNEVGPKEEELHHKIIELKGKFNTEELLGAVEGLKPILLQWIKDNEEHYLQEEKIMMPLTQKTAPTPLERCKVVNTMIINPAMARNEIKFINFVGWCVKKLSRFGSTSQSPKIAATVFIRAFHNSCLAEQWAKLMPVIKENCCSTPGKEDEIWVDLVKNFKIELPSDSHLKA